MEMYFKPKNYLGILVTLSEDRVKVVNAKTKQPIEPKLVHGQWGFLLFKKGKHNRNLVYLHEISADTFLPPPPQDRKYIRFIDRDRLNCHPRNLYFDSEPSDNCRPVHLTEYSKFYRVSPNREIWSERLRSFMRPTPGARNYPQVWLHGENGKCSWQQCHRLVGFVFVNNPNPDVFKVLHHLSGDTLDFSASNLIWTSQRTNVQEGWLAGRDRKAGAKSHRFKGVYQYQGFTAETVKEMSSHLKITPYGVQKMIDNGEVTFVPKDRLAQQSNIPAKILESVNARLAKKKKK